LRGKLKKKIARPKWFSHIPTKKRYKTVIIRKKNILILNLEETNLAGQEKKIYSDFTFSQYNHIKIFEEKTLFQHFANLIKIRSTYLLPILDLIIPPEKKNCKTKMVLPYTNKKTI
jgi:hypothetical protein